MGRLSYSYKQIAPMVTNIVRIGVGNIKEEFALNGYSFVGDDSSYYENDNEINSYIYYEQLKNELNEFNNLFLKHLNKRWNENIKDGKDNLLNKTLCQKFPNSKKLDIYQWSLQEWDDYDGRKVYDLYATVEDWLEFDQNYDNGWIYELPNDFICFLSETYDELSNHWVGNNEKLKQTFFFFLNNYINNSILDACEEINNKYLEAAIHLPYKIYSENHFTNKFISLSSAREIINSRLDEAIEKFD